MFDAEDDVHIEELQRKTAESLLFAARHWQGDAAEDGDADGDHYQTFEVDEDHNTSLTPEKKQFKSNEVESPDVIPLTQFITNPPPPQQTVDDEDDEEQAVDVWDESWVRDCTVDERINKRVSKGFWFYSMAEAWECLRQLNRPLKNDDRLLSRLYCDLCSACSGMTGIQIPNSGVYEHRLQYSTDWYSSDFIAGFAALVQHDAHITTPKFKNSHQLLMVFVPYPNNPVKKILPYGDTTHFVSVVWNCLSLEDVRPGATQSVLSSSPLSRAGGGKGRRTQCPVAPGIVQPLGRVPPHGHPLFSLSSSSGDRRRGSAHGGGCRAWRQQQKRQWRR